MYALGFLLYVLVCGTIAWLIAKLLTRHAKAPWARWAATAALAPVVFLLPLADEIVGYFQFERLCESAKEVKIYGTIRVGDELYTPDGQWRLGLQGGGVEQRQTEGARLRKVVDSYLRWDPGPSMPREIQAAIPIRRYETRIYDAKNGRLLAEWLHYGASGGWLGRNFVPGGGNLVVRSQCMPEIVLRSEIDQAIFTFAKATGSK